MKLAAAAITPGLANIGQYGTLPSAKSIQSGLWLLGRPHWPARSGARVANAATQASRTTRSRFTTSQCLPEGQAIACPRIDAVARLAPVVLVVALLAATAAAFAFAQRAKLEESPIQGIRFERRLLSPVCTACEPPRGRCQSGSGC